MDNINGGSVVTLVRTRDSVDTGVHQQASITSRLLAKAFASVLDRQLVAGATPKPGSALAVHVTRLTSAAERRRLAAKVQGLLDVAEAWRSLVRRPRPTTRRPRPEVGADCTRVLFSSRRATAPVALQQRQRPVPAQRSGLDHRTARGARRPVTAA